MGNYKEVSETGTSWVRANAVSISNPFNGVPSVTYTTERIIQLHSGEIITQQLPRYMTVNFAREGTFPMLDPVTGEPTGAVGSHAALYAMMFSLFMDTVTKKDAQEAAEAASMAAAEAAAAEAAEAERQAAAHAEALAAAIEAAAVARAKANAAAEAFAADPGNVELQAAAAAAAAEAYEADAHVASLS